MLKKTLGSLTSAALLWLPWPAYLIAVFVLLWAFWEELGDLTLAAWDDYHLGRTKKAFKTEGHHANVSGYYAHVLTMQNRVDRERKARWQAMRKRLFSRLTPFSGHSADKDRLISLHLE
jgi:hypothetical protein